MLIATAASQDNWYTSGLFYAAAGLVAAVVIGAVTVWATLFVGSIKRRITYSLAEDTPLLARTSALAEGDLDVIYQGHRATSPRVVSVRVDIRGRRDISSGDFDEGRPLAISLGDGTKIVKRLGTATEPEMPESAFGVDATRLLIGPCLIRKRQVMWFWFLVDGGRPTLGHENYLLNVDVREVAGAAHSRPPAVVAVLSALGLGWATGVLTEVGINNPKPPVTAQVAVLTASVAVMILARWVTVAWQEQRRGTGHSV